MKSVLVVIGVILFLATHSFAFTLRPRSTTLLQKRSPKTHLMQMTTDDPAKSPTNGFVGGLGVAANLVCGYSLYILETTGCNVQNGKDGLELLLAEQSASVFIILGVFIWSLITKAKTGTGLPAGPGGLLGSAEGLSFLSVLGGIVVVILNVLQYGGITSSSCVSALS